MNSKCLCFFLGISLCLLLFIPEGTNICLAADAVIKIKSCYRNPFNSDTVCKKWSFTGTGKGYLVRGEDNPDNKAAEIINSNSGDPEKVILPGSDTISAENGFILSSGNPVPFDFISPEFRKNTVFSISKKASGTVFTEKYSKKAVETTTDFARSQGWIIKENLNFIRPEKKLYMFKIIDLKTNDIVLEQLWQEGDAFWLYESSGNRFSHRIFE